MVGERRRAKRSEKGRGSWGGDRATVVPALLEENDEKEKAE